MLSVLTAVLVAVRLQRRLPLHQLLDAFLLLGHHLRQSLVEHNLKTRTLDSVETRLACVKVSLYTVSKTRQNAGSDSEWEMIG